MAIKKAHHDKEELIFYGRKLKALREKANLTQKEMAERLGYTPSVITKLEHGEVKDIDSYAERYALELKYLDFDEEPERDPNKLGYNKAIVEKYEDQLKEFFEQYIHIATYAVPDTNAIEGNPRIIEELLQKYHKVFVPDTVITELEYRKKFRTLLQNKEISKAVNTIGYEPRVITIDANRKLNGNNDDKIIDVAKRVTENYNCRIHIITDDKGFKAKQKINSDISIIRLSEFIQDRYNIENMFGLHQIDEATDNFVKPQGVNMKAYLPNGNTLITSAIRNEHLTYEMKIKKIKWLCDNGADINQRECSDNFFPPLTIAIQQKKNPKQTELVKFILDELKADPNAGSRNPFSLKMIRHQNEGNMPLMVAARSGLVDIVKMLCNHPDIILNQQDSNGFTALIKVAFHINELRDKYGKVMGFNRYKSCCEILIDKGIDFRIIDVDGHNAEYYFEYIREYIERKNKRND